jgi:hypothetical protein
MVMTINIDIFNNATLSPEECYELEYELGGLKESLQCDPVANYRVNMEIKPHKNSGQIRRYKWVGLTAFISLREGHLPSVFNERQTSALMGIEHPALNARGKVDARWALDRVARELGLEWEELVNRIEDIAKVKRHIKELEDKLRDLNNKK